jgi:hypothetical protein
LLSQPSKKRNPIEKLEPDFTRPRSDEDISIGADSRERAFQSLFL